MNTAAGKHPMSDIGRRVAARRRQLGLSREDVAERAGSATSYITYVEEQLPTPGMNFLVRLANALETSVEDLTGYTADLPTGSGRAGRHPRMVELDERECWALLGDHGVGRVAVTTQDGPAVLPVNYQVVEGEILFMTTPDSSLAATSGSEIAFEADHVDEAFSQGWSVLLVGLVRTVTDEDAARRLRNAAHSTPWAGEGRDTVMMLSPRRVTGRRIVVRGAPGERSA
ncbi:helix-turn-helix domain-containing protein [Streptomyces vilmorinianum]|uniref:helix-turn-helix domain-containing protein n=1 Tax=Streptomyces vilmorinianum TaxID=3051092 RepID=UPI0010FB016A|nr:pyridoxamine 5'-phosphate oxidase family protein [Streptomyces vilmorinianum]